MHINEKNLEEYLTQIFPNTSIIKNKKFPNKSNHNIRPDFRLDKEKIVIEFDGYQHYNNSTTIKKDIFKDNIYKSEGYNVFRIPYFIQICPISLKVIFNKELNITNNYSHGFIDDVCLLPADFCGLGYQRFNFQIRGKFKPLYNEIVNSLVNKYIKLQDIDLIVPPEDEILRLNIIEKAEK